MLFREPDDFENAPRAVVGIGNEYPASYELAQHQHRRAQLVYAASGVIAVSTPQGAWVAPPERAVWIPGDTPHAVRMVGAVQTRSVLIEPDACRSLSRACQVIGIAPLLRQLLFAAATVPVDYDVDGRDGLVMRLLVAEIESAPLVPLAVPFPGHAALAQHCHSFLEHPRADDTIDHWAGALGMNRRRFTRLFRRETGMSFVQWRQQACLSAALPRLAAGDSVTAIALDLGYDSSANFSTMFKRVLGVPPSRYS